MFQAKGSSSVSLLQLIEYNPTKSKVSPYLSATADYTTVYNYSLLALNKEKSFYMSFLNPSVSLVQSTEDS